MRANVGKATYEEPQFQQANAVLEVLQRFTEDLTALQRAIRWGEGEALEEKFRRTRDIRRSVIEAKQA